MFKKLQIWLRKYHSIFSTIIIIIILLLLFALNLGKDPHSMYSTHIHWNSSTLSFQENLFLFHKFGGII